MNRKGFSLVEILIAVGMLSGLTIGVMKMTAISKKSAKSVPSGSI